MNVEIDDLYKLIHEFGKIPKPKKAKTFLEICGYPHYENVCSNILKYFLNPKNEHGLNDLVLNALVKIIDEKFKFDIDFHNINIEREFRTINNKRLDILIQTDNYVIGIENKIYHSLNNDLIDYSKTIQSYCSHNKIPINIILSLYGLSNPDDINKANEAKFINITYAELFRGIKQDLGNHIHSYNPTYLNYLTDFIKTMQNIKSTAMENRVLNKFIHDNFDDIEYITNQFQQYQYSTFYKVNQLQELLPRVEFAPLADNQWIYDGRKDYDGLVLVHDYIIDTNKYISIDTRNDLQNWNIEVFGRDELSNEYLFNTMCKDIDFLPKSFSEYRISDINRLIFRIVSTETELQEVAGIMKDLLARMESYKKRTDLLTS